VRRLALVLALCGCGGGSAAPDAAGDLQPPCPATASDLAAPCLAEGEICLYPGLAVECVGGAWSCSAIAGCGVATGPTGAPCASDGDCQAGRGPGQPGRCMIAWSGGYCTSDCRPAETDPVSGVNPDCPGGDATCADHGDLAGQCAAWCPHRDGTIDCRPGYGCAELNSSAEGCVPSSEIDGGVGDGALPPDASTD
jgi:hypothetical protein